jgi:hypothetical protein
MCFRLSDPLSANVYRAANSGTVSSTNPFLHASFTVVCLRTNLVQTNQLRKFQVELGHDMRVWLVCDLVTSALRRSATCEQRRY